MSTSNVMTLERRQKLLKKAQNRAVLVLAGMGLSMNQAFAAVLDATQTAKIDGHVTSVTSDMGTLTGYGFDLMFIIGTAALIIGLAWKFLFRKG